MWWLTAAHAGAIDAVMTRHRFHGTFAAIVLIFLLSAGPASAQTVGARVGVSAEPDQLIVIFETGH
jgi:hypothetical protein